MALVDFPSDKDGYPTKRNVGEYLKRDSSTLMRVEQDQVRHSMRWGRGLPEILDAMDQDLITLRKGTSRPAVIVIAYAGNDIYGQHGFVDNELIENGRACKTQERRDAMEALLNQRVQDHFAALESCWPHSMHVQMSLADMA